MAVAATQRERGGVFARLRSATSETKVAVAGLAAIGVHVLDDTMFQPAKGTSIGDHLASSLIPLAVLLGAAGAYGRLRAGTRAVVAVVLGVLGIVIGGVEPAYYGPKEGLSGDDYTGLVAACGGLALVATGAAVAWRSRRRDDRLVRRYLRRALIGAAATICAFFVLLPLSLSYGFTHVARVATQRGHLGAPYQSVVFDASDGLRLKGWLVPSKNGATVIVYPGKKGTQKHARMLVRHGYGVLVFDRRGEGDSEGDPNALGWGFDRDLKGAVAFLRSRRNIDARRIGGLGLSVGGEALLQAAAETHALHAVVSDGAGARSVREDTVSVNLAKIPEIVVSGMITAGTGVFSNQLPPPNLERLAALIDRTPVFFIYAERGAGGEDNNPKYYAAARGPKELWKIQTTHTNGLTARPRQYERRVTRFFARALLGS